LPSEVERQNPDLEIVEIMRCYVQWKRENPPAKR
jgi:hypothetical protein